MRENESEETRIPHRTINFFSKTYNIYTRGAGSRRVTEVEREHELLFRLDGIQSDETIKMVIEGYDSGFTNGVAHGQRKALERVRSALGLS